MCPQYRTTGEICPDSPRLGNRKRLIPRNQRSVILCLIGVIGNPIRPRKPGRNVRRDGRIERALEELNRSTWIAMCNNWATQMLSSHPKIPNSLLKHSETPFLTHPYGILIAGTHPCVLISRATSPATSAPAHPDPTASNPSPPRRHRLHTLFELARHIGLRKGELLGLRWEDLEQGTAAVRRTLQRTSTGGLTTLPTETRASERRIALPAHCLQSPKHHLEQQHREREAAGTTRQGDGHVFTTPRAIRSTQPTSAAPSTRFSARPASATSASTTSGTRLRPCSWSRGSNSS